MISILVSELTLLGVSELCLVARSDVNIGDVEHGNDSKCFTHTVELSAGG